MIDKSKLKRMIRRTGKKIRVLYTYSEGYPEIKKQHETYLEFLEQHFVPSMFTHAYTKNRSIYTNAKVHLLNDVFIKIDVKNFFPSLNHEYLARELFFKLNKPRSNTISLSECRELVANSSIGGIGLPLGLITSPILSNIYMKRFDGLLYGRLKGLGLERVLYTRYADDIFISFKATATTHYPTEEIVKICSEELRRCHLRINDKKTRIIDLSISNHVKIAGVNIVKHEDGTRRLTISRKVVKDLYFRSLKLHEKMKQTGGNASDNEELDAEMNYIKGMQSFILSIEKTGYSHVLSEKMQNSIRQLEYESLEDLIANFKLR